MYSRHLNLLNLLNKKSLLLLGPRQTGKSTLVRNTFSNLEHSIQVDLSESDTHRTFATHPERLREVLLPDTKYILIDEAQKIPELFDEVQLIIDRNPKIRILLTGSSARKLRRSNINLLPGRIWKRNLFPLTSQELGSPRLKERADKGSLPGIIDSPDYQMELKNYAGLYLDEEVRSEGLTRSIGAFGRFLTVAALSNGEQLDFTNVSNDTGIRVNTVRGYFEILADTLIGSELPAFRKTKTRKAVATPKFYFFDPGVVNAILGRFSASSDPTLFGRAVEHIIFQELTAYLSYNNLDLPLSYWRTHSQFEVDFLLGEEIAIEVKAKESISAKDERGLNALAEDLKLKRKIICCFEKLRRTTSNGIEIIPIEDFLSELWKGDVV